MIYALLSQFAQGFAPILAPIYSLEELTLVSKSYSQSKSLAVRVDIFRIKLWDTDLKLWTMNASGYFEMISELILV